MMLTFMARLPRIEVVHAAFGELAFEVVIDGVEGRVATGVVHGVD